jgi:hypothetical protein
MGEDGGDGADLAGRLGSPGGGVQMFDEKLVHAIVGGEDLDCGAGGRGHGSSIYSKRKLTPENESGQEWRALVVSGVGIFKTVRKGAN